jgi:CelD/BcsL family acetyltransferase involved in cellulose biosynthesis
MNHGTHAIKTSQHTPAMPDTGAIQDTIQDTQVSRIEVIEQWDDFVAQASTWTALYEASPNARIFQSFEWLESWWIAYAEGREPLVLFFYNRAGQPVGAAALCVNRLRDHTRTRLQLNMLRFMGSGTGGTSTSLGILCTAGAESAVAEGFADWLEKHITRWDIVDLHLMEAELDATRALLAAMTARDWVHRVHDEGHLFTPLPDSYDTFLASLSKKMRTELPYEERRLNKAFRMEIIRIDNAADLPGACEALFEVNAKRWQAKGGEGSFGVPEKRTLCIEMCQRFFKRGWLDFWIMKLDDRVAAVELGFRQHHIYYPLWVAIDTEFNNYSPGAVLRTHIIRAQIALGMKAYEFMQGDEPYKRRWGTITQQYVTLRTMRRHGRGALDAWLTRHEPAARDFVLRVRRKLGQVLRPWRHETSGEAVPPEPPNSPV